MAVRTETGEENRIVGSLFIYRTYLRDTFEKVCKRKEKGIEASGKQARQAKASAAKIRANFLDEESPPSPPNFTPIIRLGRF